MSTVIKLAVTLVNEFGFNQKNFTSNNALIPLALYIYLKGNENYSADKGKMIHWFISATLNFIFNSGTDATLIKFRNLLNDNHKTFPLMEMLGVKDKTDDELADNLINALMNTNYKYLKNVLMALTILYDGKKNLSTVDVDHMFPKIKIKNLGEMARQGVADEDKFQTDYEKFCNALPNLQLLDSSENKKKSSTYFSDWVKNQPAEYFAENFVPDVDFRLANFKNFIYERGKLIREKLFENLKAHGIIYFNAATVQQNILPIGALTDDDEYGRAIKLSTEDFDAMKNSSEIDEKPARDLKTILDMAIRIERQFANAALTKESKYMIYAVHEGVTMNPAATKWNPSFYIVDKDLKTPRVSLDIVLQEVVPQNIFVEITKDAVDTARKISKRRGISAALEYLEETQFK